MSSMKARPAFFWIEFCHSYKHKTHPQCFGMDDAVWIFAGLQYTFLLSGGSLQKSLFKQSHSTQNLSQAKYTSIIFLKFEGTLAKLSQLSLSWEESNENGSLRISVLCVCAYKSGDLWAGLECCWKPVSIRAPLAQEGTGEHLLLQPTLSHSHTHTPQTHRHTHTHNHAHTLSRGSISGWGFALPGS